jgi:hypothetical protein
VVIFFVWRSERKHQNAPGALFNVISSFFEKTHTLVERRDRE